MSRSLSRPHRIDPAFAEAVDALGIHWLRRRMSGHFAIWPPRLVIEVACEGRDGAEIWLTPLQACRVRRFAEGRGLRAFITLSAEDAA